MFSFTIAVSSGSLFKFTEYMWGLHPYTSSYGQNRIWLLLELLEFHTIRVKQIHSVKEKKQKKEKKEGIW